MSRNKPKYEKKRFESTLISSDTSANIYNSMMLSEAWLDLSASAKVLYVVCKDQYYHEKKKPIPNDPESFTMNQNKWSEVYQLYKKTNARGFYRDMEQLIKHGFVELVQSGAATRTKSIYRFSNDWWTYRNGSLGSPVNLVRPERCEGYSEK